MDKQEKIEGLKARNLEWNIPWDAVYLIADAEDCSLKAYKCPAGVWTIGWGETEGVHPGMVWTQGQCDLRFHDQINHFSDKVAAMCTEHVTQHQLGALTSLAYNIGLEGLRKSTVLKAHNAGNHPAAARAFQLWNKARVNGNLVPLPGLTARRAAEAAIYLSQDDSPFREPPVQAVESETKLTRSHINVASATGATTGIVAVAGSMFDGILPLANQAKELASTFGLSPPIILGTIVVASCFYSMYYRVKQRSEGWA